MAAAQTRKVFSGSAEVAAGLSNPPTPGVRRVGRIGSRYLGKTYLRICSESLKKESGGVGAAGPEQSCWWHCWAPRRPHFAEELLAIINISGVGRVALPERPLRIPGMVPESVFWSSGGTSGGVFRVRFDTPRCLPSHFGVNFHVLEFFFLCAFVSCVETSSNGWG